MRAIVSLEMVMTGHQVVEVDHFERGMHEFGRDGRPFEEEECVMIARLVAAIAAHEGSDRDIRGRLDFIRGHEAEAGFVPGLGPSEVGHAKHDMAEPLDV